MKTDQKAKCGVWDNLGGSWDNFRRLVTNDPEFNEAEFIPREPGKEPPEFATLDKLILEEQNRRVFVIGAWGSGKTTLLRHYFSKREKEITCRKRLFFSVAELNEAYLHLLNICTRVCALLFLLCAGTFAVLYVPDCINSIAAKFGYREIPNLKLVLSLLGILAAALLYQNKFKLTYALLSWIEGLNNCPDSPRDITLIEDLDRSSLSKEDRWALLANLWTHNRQYVVTLGYNSEEEKAEIIEICSKLEGAVLHLDADYRILHKIAKKYDPDFPFKESPWLNHLSAREILRLIGEVKTKSLGGSDAFKKLMYFRCFFSRMLETIPSLTPSELGNSAFRKEGRTLTFQLGERAEAARFSWKQLKDFCESCPIEFYNQIEEFIPDNDGILKRTDQWRHLNYVPYLIEGLHPEFDQVVFS